MTENWTEFGVGAFILIAPWIFGFADIPLARWTDVLAGLVLVLMNLWAIYGKDAAFPAGTAAADKEKEGFSMASVSQMMAQTVAVKSSIVVKKEERPKRGRRAKVEKVLINS